MAGLDDGGLIPNLVKRNIDVSLPDRIGVTDVTCLRTWQGRPYLAVVLDLFSSNVIRWAACQRKPNRPRRHQHRGVVSPDELETATRQSKPVFTDSWQPHSEHQRTELVDCRALKKIDTG